MISTFVRRKPPTTVIKVFSSNFSSLNDKDVVAVSFARTPIGKFGGGLSTLTATDLGAIAIEEAVKRAGIKKEIVEEAFMGNVVSAGVGQAPTRQAVIYAGLHVDTPCTTINKVCASGMKALMLASQSIASGYRSVMIAGGMESMSNIPYYLPGARTGYRLGNNTVIDGMVHDGLWDVYNDKHMGNCGDLCASKHSISREDQDKFALMSYEKAKNAWENGKFDEEVIACQAKDRKKTVISKDEEFSDLKIDKVPTLRPAFNKNGTVTAANASKLNDGASAFVLTSGKFAKENNLKPLFKIRGYGDAARDPVEFTIAPADAVPRALRHAGVAANDIDFHEINEGKSMFLSPQVSFYSIDCFHDPYSFCSFTVLFTLFEFFTAFSVVALANANLLNLDINKVNVHGGAVALGHPIGSSGSRIIGTLYHVLKSNDASLGCASICNGGGGASAIVIERCN